MTKKIINHENIYQKFGDLYPGDWFTDTEDIFISIEEIESCNAVRIDNGELQSFDHSTNVIKIDEINITCGKKNFV